jgi:hypothetical protein
MTESSFICDDAVPNGCAMTLLYRHPFLKLAPYLIGGCFLKMMMMAVEFCCAIILLAVV